MSLGRAALAYAYRIGIAVHPIARSKAPLSPSGFKDATTDERQIRTWWERNPDANIGARCDWFFVLDVDPRNGGDRVLHSWLSMHGSLPTTWESGTGAGGSHFYFQHDPSLDSIPLGSLKGTGCDIKGGGRGYVLLPPSVSSSGPYQWIVRPTETPLAMAPAWLIRAIHRLKARPVASSAPVDFSQYQGIDRVERARRYAATVPGAIQGSGGSDATIRVACIIARGFALTHEEAFAVLSEWNRTCEPSWPDSDLKKKINDTLTKGSAPMGFMLNRGRRAA